MVKNMNLLISFSGGRTSAYMTYWLLKHKRNDFDEIKVVFANTGQEHEETLKFVDRCDTEFNFNVIWVEAKVFQNERKGTSFNIVDFKTASRNGEPYEDMIKKYGIPNKTHPICTRELKLRPIQAYLKQIGWKKRNYQTALGIRCDEVERISSRCVADKIIYPLIEFIPVDKTFINDWWLNQSFNLFLPEHKGNCTWCWKKSKRKLLTLAAEDPNIFNFPLAMEEKYGYVGAEFSKNNEIKHKKRVFFRENKSTKDILLESKLPFIKFTDKNYQFNIDMDSPNGCTESCEIFPTK